MRFDAANIPSVGLCRQVSRCHAGLGLELGGVRYTTF